MQNPQSSVTRARNACSVLNHDSLDCGQLLETLSSCDTFREQKQFSGLMCDYVSAKYDK